MIAGAVALLAAAGVGWWVTTGGEKEDPCATYQEQMAQARAADYANSREERRAIAEVVGRAHDAGCEVDDPSAGGESR